MNWFKFWNWLWDKWRYRWGTNWLQRRADKAYSKNMKDDYRKRFYDAIATYNREFGMDLRPEIKDDLIYVFNHVAREPQSPFISEYQGFKEAAERYEELLMGCRMGILHSKGDD